MQRSWSWCVHRCERMWECDATSNGTFRSKSQRISGSSFLYFPQQLAYRTTKLRLEQFYLIVGICAIYGTIHYAYWVFRNGLERCICSWTGNIEMLVKLFVNIVWTLWLKSQKRSHEESALASKRRHIIAFFVASLNHEANDNRHFFRTKSSRTTWRDSGNHQWGLRHHIYCSLLVHSLRVEASSRTAEHQRRTASIRSHSTERQCRSHFGYT